MQCTMVDEKTFPFFEFKIQILRLKNTSLSTSCIRLMEKKLHFDEKYHFNRLYGLSTINTNIKPLCLCTAAFSVPCIRPYFCLGIHILFSIFGYCDFTYHSSNYQVCSNHTASYTCTVLLILKIDSILIIHCL